MRHLKNTFTLVELLIVISIIAILAFMLLPALKSVREKTKQISCINNLKQFGTANIMYSQDYSDFFPVSNETSGKLWDWQLSSYVNYDWNAALKYSAEEGAFSIYHCPSGKRTFSDRTRYRSRGYGYNDAVFSGSKGKIIQMSNLSELVLMTDGSYGVEYDYMEGYTSCGLSNASRINRYHIDGVGASSWCAITYRHTQRTNVLFADAHGASQKRSGSYDLPENTKW